MPLSEEISRTWRLVFLFYENHGVKLAVRSVCSPQKNVVSLHRKLTITRNSAGSISIPMTSFILVVTARLELPLSGYHYLKKLYLLCRK